MIKGSKDYDSIGVPIPNSKIKIMDQQTDEPLGPHENGQIYVWKSQSRSQESTSNQWIQTGHFGHYDSEGFFYFNSNNDLLIQIQNQLAQHLLVQQAVVIALNDDQNLIGFISLNSNESVNLNELKQFINGIDNNIHEMNEKLFKNSMIFIKEFSNFVFISDQMKTTKKLDKIIVVKSFPYDCFGKVNKHKLKYDYILSQNKVKY